MNIEDDYSNNILANKLNKNNDNPINKIVKKKIIKNNNIIIINNNNVLNEQQKMEYLFNPIINDKNNIKQNYEKIIKKIDTSISVEKPRRNNKSPKKIEINENSVDNNRLKGKKIFFKNYVKTTTLKDDLNNEKNDDKIKDIRKKILPSLHIKSNTNLENYNHNSIKNNTYYNDFKFKDNSLIDSFINSENNYTKKNIYQRIRINSNLNTSLIHKCSPDDKIYSRYADFKRYINSSMNNEKLNTEGNYIKDNRKSLYDRGNKKYIIELINTNESVNSIDNPDNNDKSKDNFHKKINLIKLRQTNNEIKVNKLALNDSSIANKLPNNISSYRDNFPYKHSYLNNDKMNKTLNIGKVNKIESKRLKLMPKGIINNSILNDSITYSKKICTQNNTYAKSNNYLMLSTNLNLYQIIKRLSKFCFHNNLFFKQNGNKYMIIINKDDEFMLDIKSSEGNNIIKFTHEKGEENHTKIFMNNLFAEIAK